ncbi:MAG: GNAT family N-acetyltransferase [Pseudomonadota bacterium]
MASAIPITRDRVAPEKADAIREAVRTAKRLPLTGGHSRRAEPGDAAALCEFLSDPAVYAPIYTLPVPLTDDTVCDFIVDHEAQAAAGEGLLFLRMNETGAVMGYSDFQIWPQWGAGELGGALHPNLQSQGAGARGAAATFDWMFSTLGLDLICETATPDNVRTARLLDGLGFKRMGEVQSTRPDGSTRRSLVWEITRAAWQSRHPA